MQVKICGTTSVEDARFALDAGADWVGVIVHHPPSPRNVSLQTAREIKAVVGRRLVLLTVGQSLPDLRDLSALLAPEILQLHGDETPKLVAGLANSRLRVWKAIHGDGAQLLEQARQYRDAGAEALVVDARDAGASGTVYGGTGKVADWNAARQLVDDGFRVVLAGGLDPDNVARAVATVNPFGVDCVSGVESAKGVKDAEKVRAFVAAARE